MKLHAIGDVLNSFFDRVIVLTIGRNTQRRVEIEKQFDGTGLRYQFFWGYDGEELDVARIERQGLYDADLNRQHTKVLLTRNELACALSHRQICGKMLESGWERVLVLEDDVQVRETNLALLSQSLEQCPDGWELIYLGYCRNNMRMPFVLQLKCLTAYRVMTWLRLKSYNIQEIQNMFRRPFNSHWDRAGRFNGAFAYGLTAHGARKVLDFQTPVTMQSDWAFQQMVMKGMLCAYSMVYDVFDARFDLPSSIGMRPSWK